MTEHDELRLLDGIAILDPKLTELLHALDQTFSDWGFENGAQAICPPPVYRTSDLAKFDVYVNFPHLSFVAGPLDASPESQSKSGSFSPAQIQTADLGLPTATCFGAYLFLEDRQVPDETLITLVNRCFRHEDHYDGLRRLLSFQMREIVAVGSYQHAREHLEKFGEKVTAFAENVDISLDKLVAHDPFFERSGARSRMQELQAVKHEFQSDGLAIASVNMHRNFFGERCNIRTGDGAVAFTSCVAFGLERWLSVLVDRHGTAAKATDRVLDAARVTVRQ
ncbi:hypothetical protein [Amycolatopsis nigrescens]|uniref:hypothetical protein n=1 Tax=Amycolatopsis nigrescens TaxID=381445 RepID=UPI00035EBB80|nr:hypothetical protein [Amycolatopsis nigrescens]